MPFFEHRFIPAITGTPLDIELSVREIEDAGLKEVLQTPGVQFGQWGLLGPLLHSGTRDFVFREPLGQAREVKTALSGLFGRFVARAYATSYLNLTAFDHVTKPPMVLTGRMRGVARRVGNTRGDLPDWVAWGPKSGLAIVEAKGSHDPSGPGKTLARAYEQACRLEIVAGTRRARFKRYAIASRWGHAAPSLTRPMLWVKDPDEPGSASEEERRDICVGVLRRHIASLIRPLGQDALAEALRGLVAASRGMKRAIDAANEALDSAPVYRASGADYLPDDDLIGGLVVRSGPLRAHDISISDQDTLERLDLGPTFVGVKRSAVIRAINGDVEAGQGDEIAPHTVQAYPTQERARDDGGGVWVLRLDRGEGRVQRLRPSRL